MALAGGTTPMDWRTFVVELTGRLAWPVVVLLVLVLLRKEFGNLLRRLGHFRLGNQLEVDLTKVEQAKQEAEESLAAAAVGEEAVSRWAALRGKVSGLGLIGVALPDRRQHDFAQQADEDPLGALAALRLEAKQILINLGRLHQLNYGSYRTSPAKFARFLSRQHILPPELSQLVLSVLQAAQTARRTGRISTEDALELFDSLHPLRRFYWRQVELADVPSQGDPSAST